MAGGEEGGIKAVINFAASKRRRRVNATTKGRESRNVSREIVWNTGSDTAPRGR